MSRAFQVEAADNVATLLEDAGPGPVEILGAARVTVEAPAPVELGHKLALRVIAQGEPVIKFGVAIGVATRGIAQGEWVHLHNCASLVDERSATLDVATGATTDMRYD